MLHALTVRQIRKSTTTTDMVTTRGGSTNRSVGSVERSFCLPPRIALITKYSASTTSTSWSLLARSGRECTGARDVTSTRDDNHHRRAQVMRKVREIDVALMKSRFEYNPISGNL